MLATQYEQVIVEFWDVPEENQAAFLDYFRTIIMGGLKAVKGYDGSLILKEETLPGWTRVIQPHQGTRQLGVHTNATVNLSSLLSGEYTFSVIHLFTERDPDIMLNFFGRLKELIPDWRERYADHPDEPASPLWLDQLKDIYAFAGDGDTSGISDELVADAIQITKVMSYDFFGLIGNHWDVFYQVISSVPAEPAAA